MVISTTTVTRSKSFYSNVSLTFLRHVKFVPLIILNRLCGLHTKVKGFISTSGELSY